jgi:hypothetical protein
MSDFRWFVPTWFGDIRLHKEGKQTRVEIFKLTRRELEAVKALREHSLKKKGFRKPWAQASDWDAMPKAAFITGRKESNSVTLNTPIHTVQKFLTGQLQTGRDAISVMISKGGDLYEINVPDGQFPEPETPEQAEAAASFSILDNLLPFRKEANPDPAPAAAVTVPRPVLGCPAPDFAKAHIRANEVLRNFVTPEQMEDFERYQRFVTVGGLSGRRYMLTSRHARSELSTYHRTVYDLEADTPLCVHDWSVPAAEELLVMHLHLQSPRWEEYVRWLPEKEEVMQKEVGVQGFFMGDDGVPMPAPAIQLKKGDNLN